MSKFYNAKRKRNLFDPASDVPFKLSRSKIDLFLNCPRCFYLDRRLGVGQPPGYPFSLNSAVDKLLKKEFDMHRAKETAHAIDDIWANSKKELFIVDYKATAKDGEVSFDADWQIGYKRQMEVYQWLFRKNGFIVSDTGYFVYANGDADREAFDAKLEFDVKIIPYEGNDGWVSGAVEKIYACLKSSLIPKASEDCDFCAYRRAAAEVEENEGLV
jgi:hypothetical protein